MINKKAIQVIIVFSLFFTIFLSWHSMHAGLLGTDDPYYHAKHSSLMAESNNYTLVEPWVPFHYLSYAPADLWWLYHVIAAGCIKLFGIIWGAKIWSAITAALVFAVFYFILKQLKIFYPFVWTFLLFISSSTFTIRLLFERPFVLSIAFLMLCFYFIYQRQSWLLFFTLIVYALFYELAPIALLLVVIFLLVDWYLKREINLKPLIFSLAGLLMGVIIHPQALNYIYVIYLVLFKIYYLKLIGVNLNIGAELQVRGFSDFLENNIIIIGFYLTAVALFIKTFLAQESNRLQLALFLISVFWFSVSMFVPRGTEYWLPFGYLFIAAVFNSGARSDDWTTARAFIKQKAKVGVILFFLYSVIMVFAGYNMFNAFNVLESRNQNDVDIYYQQANDWLIKNTPPNSVVFYPIWSMFPQMFFFNNHNRYLTAFDPTFLYEYNPAVYYLWANIAYRGVYCPHEWPCLELSPRQQLRMIKPALTNILGAKTIVIPNLPETWPYKVFTNFSRDFKKEYENKELIIFQIMP